MKLSSMGFNWIFVPTYHFKSASMMITILQFLVSVVVVCLAKANKQISFELLDSEFNEVIFVGERNIVMRCRVIDTNIPGLSIVIEHGDNSTIVGAVLYENCLDYTIKVVSLNDGGTYRCKVAYANTDSTVRSEAQSLDLNVLETRPQCFRNGTEGHPYRDGDHLLMSCYCWKTDDCRWVSEVIGSSNLNFIASYEDFLNRNKTIRRILVETTDRNAKYTCFFISHAVQGCSIGPQDVSSNDIIISSSPSASITDTSNPPPTCSATTPTPLNYTERETSDPLTSAPSSKYNCGGEGLATNVPSSTLSQHELPSGMAFIVIIIILTTATILLFLSLLILIRERRLLKKKLQTRKDETSTCLYDRAIFIKEAEKSSLDRAKHIYESTSKDIELQQSEPLYDSVDKQHHYN